MYRCSLFILLLIAGFLLPPGGSASAKEVKVAIRIIRGMEAGLKQWQPTVDYLNGRIDGHTFKLLPFVDLNELSVAAKRGEFDFVITNPSSYVEMEINSGASRILTLINKRQGKPYTEFGSVIYARADRADIKTFEDLKGKTIMAVSGRSFGGWRVAWDEILKHGIDPFQDMKEVNFIGLFQKHVAYAVRDGKADVGVARTDMLERMAAKGLINLDDFYVIGQKDSKDFPFLRSTDLYPEWAFAQLPMAPTGLSHEVVHALLDMPADSAAAKAGKYVGWSVPLNYQPVHDLLRTLKTGPYEDFGKVTLQGALLTYRYWIAATTAILLVLFATGSFALTRNRQLARLRSSMLADKDRELDFQKLALDEHAIVSITDDKGDIIYANDKFCEISGYARDELLGQNHRILKSGEYSPELYEEMWRTISSGRPWHGEVKNQKKDGGHYWVKATIVPFLDGNGEPFQYVAIRTDITERKLVEEELQEREDQLRDFGAAASDWYWEMDKNLRFSYFSEGFTEVTGVPQNVLLGKTRQEDGNPGAGAEQWLKHLETLTEHRPFRNFVHPRTKPDGGVVWLSINGKPVFDASDRFRGYRGTGMDITESKAAEEKLKKHTIDMELMHGVTTTASMYTDTNMALRSILEYICRFMDWSVAHVYVVSQDDPDTLVPSNIWYSSDIDLYAEFRDLTMKTRFKKGVGLPGRVFASGEPFWIQNVTRDQNFPRAESAEASGIKSGVGLPVNIAGKTKAVLEFYSTEDMEADKDRLNTLRLVSDQIGMILERMEAEELLRDSEQRNRLLLVSAAEGIYGLDLEGRTTFVNPAVCHMLGYTEKELIGQSMHDLIHHSYPDGSPYPREKCYVYAAFTDGKVHQATDEVLWRKDGSSIPVEYTSNPIHKDGKVTGAVVTFRDITERREADEALREAMEKAENANKAKSEFLSSMSHELRTPLNAILGFSQMLDYNPKEPLTEAQKSSVSQIMKGGHHLLELINDILDLAKIEAGKVELSMEDIRMRDVVDECLAMVGDMAAARKIDIVTCDKTCDVITVRADYTRTKQVLLNLISNAIKYNHDGGSIKIGCKTTPEGMLRVLVKDTGHGIKASRQKDVFKPFNRLGAEHSDIEGTGIGLVVCENLMQLMDGKIGFDSVEGEGSTFFFELPISQNSTIDIGASAPVLEGGNLQAMDGVMLYVEDNPSNLQLMKMIVSNIDGLTMLSADTAELGIEIAKNKHPDLIMLDINLPGMSGLDAVKALKGMDETRDIPTLALSAAATKTDIARGLDAGFNRYLTKPLRVPEITTAIKEALNG